MPITVAKNAGFCMGVERAVKGALETLENEQDIVSYGELAHNPDVISFLSERGLQVIHSVEEAVGKTVLIRSHGVSPVTLEALCAVSNRVIDLTCPFVQRLHEFVAQYSADGLPVILVGQENHPEVVGTVGCAKGSVFIVSSIDEADALPQMQEALAVCQTTFPKEQWLAILTRLNKKVNHLTSRNTICTATAQRQLRARELAEKASCMIVVGGKSSANTHKLYETCHAICPRTILVERAADIPPGFANIHSDDIGITAGASTPDWSIKEVVTRMTEMEQMNQETMDMADVEASMVRIKPGQTVKGTVVMVTDDVVGVDIGYKSDGLLKREDLVDENVKVGDEIEVEVVKVNDGEGNVLLSQRNILVRKAFAELVEKFNNNEYVEGTVKEAVKGGLICFINGVRAFVPASLVSNKFVEKIDSYVGQNLELKIIEIDEQKKRVVASHRQVVREKLAAKKQEVWSKLEENAVVKGIVRRLTDFGAFVDLGGVDGLIHVTDLSWARVNNPADVVSPDQEVEVQVLHLDRDKERIQLGLKQLQPKPWDLAPEKYAEGSIVTGKVVRITTFGAFVELEPGIDGLIHISQCANKRINKVEDAVNVGDEVTVKVLNINPETKRISLSIRALQEPEKVEEPAAESVEAEAVPVDVETVEDVAAAETEENA